MWSDALILVVSVFAGGIAAVTGFGIGSLLTPVLALQLDTRLAVAAVSVPHVIGTAVRFWLLSGRVDRRRFLYRSAQPRPVLFEPLRQPALLIHVTFSPSAPSYT
jgi:uncharacterized membrane protein YfcA